MDLLTRPIKPLYFRYLAACFGSSLITSIYALVDCIVVGQYEGPDGAAALAVIMPLWSMFFSLGMLFGVGGAVLMSTARGAGDKERGDQYWTVAFFGGCGAAALLWAGLFLFRDELLTLFGASAELLPLARRYVDWVILAAPLFLVGQLLSTFLRNDGAPQKATLAVIAGGVCNICGDVFFVFTCDIGIAGAGLATALGQLVAFLVLCTHFISPKCTLRFRRVERPLAVLGRVTASGASSFLTDIAVGVLSTLFNNQIMRYFGSDALAVYGVIANVTILVQSCAYGVGNAAQPLLSTNYGGGKYDRVRRVLGLSIGTAFVLGAVWCAANELFPGGMVRLFMRPTQAVLDIAPDIIRVYALSYVLFPFNIFMPYYFQSVMAAPVALGLSVSRGLAVSGALIVLLPVCIAPEALWWAMPAAELVIAAVSWLFLRRSRRSLREAHLP
ncbi:MATE family efflux transporter [Pseudoflavonifractor phocaeensis]|uniref:MATE family efflux transporter n=1 Tax=Pseudoflavonifractor phocaeensis TaxID=1870988 RepID=UPI00195D73FE|nr:polysaccharide biosynthesis C-terminal domain-containing protein [Pseudoflavonifractor phocaeensis]